MLPFSLDTEVRWNEVKNQRLKKTRGVSFQEVLKGTVVGIVNHPTKGNQSIVLIEFKKYIWVVPFVQQGNEVFLKTLYPSRKYTKRHGRGA